MSQIDEIVYIAAISFITVLILDFIAIELVLKLGVFSLGRVWVRVSILLTQFLHALTTFLFNIYGGKDFIYMDVQIWFWVVWSILYFLMLIEQNSYWISDTFRKRLYIIWIVVIANVLALAIVFFLIGTFVLPIECMHYVDILDLLLLIILSSVELFLAFKIYNFCKDRVKSVSYTLWKKVIISVYIVVLCVIIDIIVISLEYSGYSRYCYLFKPGTFAFKVIFECMCFQFIKGIVVSIETPE
jgi:hypothetical protein